MAFLPRSEPPAPTRAEAVEKLPGKLCLLALLAATGLYCYSIFVVPASTEDPSGMTQVAAFYGRNVQGYPAILGALLVIAIVPAVFFPRSARKYLLRLTVLFTIAWALLFIAVEHPTDKAADTVRGALSASRNLPDPIR